jgi:hypothetical protein
MYRVKVLHSQFDYILATLSVFLVFLLDTMVLAENTCSTFCTSDYRPVCAGDGVSDPIVFGNPCSFEYHNCANPDKRKFRKNKFFPRTKRFLGKS